VRRGNIVVMDDQTYRELLDRLGDLVALLRVCDEGHWADWLDEDQGRLLEFDGYALDHLLSAYGGAGSLTDLVIDPINGHSVAPDELGETNRRLSELRSAVHVSATALRRSL
jgi:hypothetical protein